MTQIRIQQILNFAAGVIASALTGLSVSTISAVVATDSILVAAGKLQAQITDLYASKTSANITINAISANYTLVLTDNGKLIQQSDASANTLTVPPNSSVAFPIGAQVLINQFAAGVITITPGAGVTVNVSATRLKTNGQYALATLIKVGTDSWLLGGDLTA